MYKSRPLELIGQVCRDAIGCKTRVNERVKLVYEPVWVVNGKRYNLHITSFNWEDIFNQKCEKHSEVK